MASSHKSLIKAEAESKSISIEKLLFGGLKLDEESKSPHVLTELRLFFASNVTSEQRIKRSNRYDEYATKIMALYYSLSGEELKARGMELTEYAKWLNENVPLCDKNKNQLYMYESGKKLKPLQWEVNGEDFSIYLPINKYTNPYSLNLGNENEVFSYENYSKAILSIADIIDSFGLKTCVDDLGTLRYTVCISNEIHLRNLIEKELKKLSEAFKKTMPDVYPAFIRPLVNLCADFIYSTPLTLFSPPDDKKDDVSKNDHVSSNTA